MCRPSFRLFRRLLLFSIILTFSAAPVLSQQTDTTFGTNGLVVSAYSTGDPLGRIVTIIVKAFYLPSGQILCVVSYDEVHPEGAPVYSLRLFRFSNNGALEAQIGGIGNFEVTDAVQQPDGKIVAVGYRYGNTTNRNLRDWIVARLSTDGSLDASFGANGFITRGFAANEDIINNVALQSDGKIVVSGTSSNAANGTVTLVGRFNADGSIDYSFGPYGEGFFDIYDAGSLSKKLLIKPDGKILIAGNIPLEPSANDDNDLILAQYNGDGLADDGFGNGGFKIIDYGGQELLADIKFQTDGKILVLANKNYAVYGTTNYREQEMVLSRLNVDGSADASFGAGGLTVINSSPPSFIPNSTTPPSGFEIALNLIVEDNGSILVSGISQQIVSSEKRNVLALFQFDSAGRIVAKNFSRLTLLNQVVSTQVGSANFNFAYLTKGMLVQPDGKILLYGWMDKSFYGSAFPPFPDSTKPFVLARYASISAVNDANNFFDYNFDGKADISVFRPSSGFWYWLTSSSNQLVGQQLGTSGDILAPGDYDGVGVLDLAVFRPSTGEWITQKDYLNGCAPASCAESVQFGASGDIPAPGDFDGDGKFDRAVYRPSEGIWYILFSSGGYTGVRFGASNDLPVTGDYDGDGKADIAVIRRENGQIFWYILQSSNGAFVGLPFGASDDKAVPADYNGDGRTEIAVWRPSNGTWYLLTNYADFSYAQLGQNGDVPEPADYDGDRKADFAVFTPSTGIHAFIKSSDGSVVRTQFGISTDIPIASAYVR